MMKVPEFKDPAVTKFLTEYIREVDRTNKDVLHSHTANQSLLLYGSGKDVYKITVNDSGTVVATKVYG